MWSVFSFYQPFAVLTVDQFFGRGGGPLERQKQDNQIYPKNWHIVSDFSEKSESSLHRRRSLRNYEKEYGVLNV